VDSLTKPCEAQRRAVNAYVSRDGLVNAMLAFLEWMAAEKRAVPTA
jgi:hypothetical protein